MKRKWWLYIAIIIALGFVVEVGLYTGVVVAASRMDNPEPADVLIVLGAQIDHNGKPKLTLQYRLDRALELYEQGYAKTIITCGAQGTDEPMPEADAMKRYLAEKGVPEAAILTENASYNTQQSIENAKVIMEANGLSSAIVVTSKYHLWRSVNICRDLGIPATGAGSKDAPSPGVAFRNKLRETASWVKYFLTRLW